MYPPTPGDSGLPDCHKKVLDEYCRAGGVAEDIERFFEVGVSVGEVGADPKVFEIFGGGFAEAGGQRIGGGVAHGSVAAPSACVQVTNVAW